MMSNNPYILFVGFAAFFLLYGAKLNVGQLRASQGKSFSVFTFLLIIIGGGCVLAVLHDAQVIS